MLIKLSMCLKVCAVHLRGKCERDSCKYFHAPWHLRSRVKDVSFLPSFLLIQNFALYIIKYNEKFSLLDT